MDELETARKFRKKAETAAADLDNFLASEFFLKAARHYGRAGETFWQKSCEGWGWSRMAVAMNPTKDPDEDNEQAFCYDRSIMAFNSALRYSEVDQPIIEGNMRFAEGSKYTALANAEVRRAVETTGEAKASHQRHAAEYRLSGATARKQAAELRAHDMVNYYCHMGDHHEDRSGYHFYRGWADETLENWPAALEEYERAKAESEKAISYYRKSLQIKLNRGVESNYQQAQSGLNKRIDAITCIRPKAERMAAEISTSETGLPSLDVSIETTEGMIENLVSTLSVVLANRGGSEARNISIALNSQFLEGDTSAALTRLAAGGDTCLGISVLPNKAGSPTATLNISYEDASGRSYSQLASAVLNVSRREDKRPEAKTIINVKGDYAHGSVIRDSPMTRPSIGSDGGDDLMSRLRELAEMKREGLLSDEEFARVKSKLLE